MSRPKTLMQREELSESRQKVELGLVEGNLRHMVDRVATFKKVIEERKASGKRIIRTPETERQEMEAKELEKFMDFSLLFGKFSPSYCMLMGEVGILGRPTEYKYDIYEWTEPNGKVMQEIRYKNMQLWWPIRIIQQIYAMDCSKWGRKIIHA